MSSLSLYGRFLQMACTQLIQSALNSVQAFTWQIGFAVSPEALGPLDRALKLDERILRHIVVKTDPFPAFPTSHSVGKSAARQLEKFGEETNSHRVDAITSSAPPEAN